MALSARVLYSYLKQTRKFAEVFIAALQPFETQLFQLTLSESLRDQTAK